MILFKKAADLHKHITDEKKKGQTIGFVPTMGALHEGHLALIEASKSSSGFTVCSLFVNPAQFNNPDDFKNYPVTIDEDIESLVQAGCDVLFLPAVSQIYPEGYQKKHYDLGYLESVLEGAYRPGHYQGVCQVVDKLLQLAQPDNLYLGQKDFQQCMVISKLIEDEFNNAIAIYIVPTLRESDGLAMSSRNLRLTPGQRALAPAIYQQLQMIQQNYTITSFAELEQSAQTALTEKGFAVDYVSVKNADDLSPADPDNKHLVALTAASIGSVRLIDNLILR